MTNKKISPRLDGMIDAVLADGHVTDEELQRICKVAEKEGHDPLQFAVMLEKLRAEKVQAGNTHNEPAQMEGSHSNESTEAEPASLTSESGTVLESAKAVAGLLFAVWMLYLLASWAYGKVFGPNMGILDVRGSGYALQIVKQGDKGKDQPVVKATAPARLELEPGDYILTVSLAGHEPRRININIPSRDTRLLMEDEIAPRKFEGTLMVLTEPNVVGGLVKIDGEDAGSLPLTINLPPKKVRIDVEYEEYQGSGTALIVDGKTLTQRIKLKPRNGSDQIETFREGDASLSILSEPYIKGGMVSINGRPAGELPLQNVRVPSGKVRISVVAGEFRGEREIMLTSGEENTVEVELRPQLSGMNQ